jgi:hypothetical protein
VLLNIEEYRRLPATHRRIGDLLAIPGTDIPGVAGIEFETPNPRDLAIPAELS